VIAPLSGAVTYGNDVSHFQNDAGPINWSAIKNANKEFVFVKLVKLTTRRTAINNDLVSDHTVENVQGARDR